MRKWTILAEAAVVLFWVMSCAKQPLTTQANAPAPGGSPQQPPAAAARPRPSEFEPVAGLNDVHFDFDKYEIRPEPGARRSARKSRDDLSRLAGRRRDAHYYHQLRQGTSAVHRA